MRHYQPLIEQVIAQSFERRVLAGEPVPAAAGSVSLFEPHADIIVKGSREVDYGHKLNLTVAGGGLILDLVVEAGNPADSERLLPMLKHHIAGYGEAPRQLAADGGFATRDNLSQAKARGVCDLAFHKKRGLRIEDMVRSRWVYRIFRNFRAGIEADVFVPQACLRSGPLHLARPRRLQGLRPVPRWSPTTSPSSRVSNPPERTLGRTVGPSTRRRPPGARLDFCERLFHAPQLAPSPAPKALNALWHPNMQRPLQKQIRDIVAFMDGH